MLPITPFRANLLTLFPAGEGLKVRIIVPFPADDERMLAESIFRGRTWPTITATLIKERYPGPISELPGMMTDVAFAYFIPAFMACTTEEPGQTDCLGEALLLRLFNAEEDSAIAVCLNVTQKAYVASYLQDIFADARTFKMELRRVTEWLA